MMTVDQQSDRDSSDGTLGAAATAAGGGAGQHNDDDGDDIMDSEFTFPPNYSRHKRKSGRFLLSMRPLLPAMSLARLAAHQPLAPWCCCSVRRAGAAGGPGGRGGPPGTFCCVVCAG